MRDFLTWLETKKNYEPTPMCEIQFSEKSSIFLTHRNAFHTVNAFNTPSSLSIDRQCREKTRDRERDRKHFLNAGYDKGMQVNFT